MAERRGLQLSPGARVELMVGDSPLARAFFDGVPAARLLGRARLGSDERDVSVSAAGTTVSSTWDALVRALLGERSPALDRVKRAIAKHARVAADEGPLEAGDMTIATLVFAVAHTVEPDASLAEIALELAAADPDARPHAAVERACAEYDSRLAGPPVDAKPSFFEACTRLASLATMGPLPWEWLRGAAIKLGGRAEGDSLLCPMQGSLFPRESATQLSMQGRRIAALDRTGLDMVLARDAREIASEMGRIEREQRNESAPGELPRARLDGVIADLARLLSHKGTLVLAIVPPQAPLAEEADSEPYARTVAGDWAAADFATRLADAIEEGALTLPTLRAAVAAGGELALDGIGAEMLRVAAHPFASAAFADLLARSGRPRDVMRLVTYFAVAPDPAPAARALGACTAPELPRVLAAWLEAMLPSDGQPALLGDDDADRSSAARLTACVASLSPYPHLYRAVRPLLSRISEAPPPPSAGAE